MPLEILMLIGFVIMGLVGLVGLVVYIYNSTEDKMEEK